MKENETTKCRIQIDNGLLAYLNPESGDKCSKMAAFRNLIEIATGDKKEFPAIAKPLPERQVALTVSGLAKHWNWHRTTVRKFLTALEEAGAVKVIGLFHPSCHLRCTGRGELTSTLFIGRRIAFEPLAVWLPCH